MAHRLLTAVLVLVACGTLASQGAPPAPQAPTFRLNVENVEVDAVANTLNGFPFHTGRTGAPVLDQAVAYVECELRQEVEVGDHTLFLGEVVASAFQQDESVEILRMEDTRMSYGG